MDFKIKTDLLPKVTGIKHDRENWDSSDADKFNDAYEFLNYYDHHGYLELFFDSKTQRFSVIEESCRELSKMEIARITDLVTNSTKERN
jgi:hypothetical protein